MLVTPRNRSEHGAIALDHRAMLEREQPDRVFAITDYAPEVGLRHPDLLTHGAQAGCDAWIAGPPLARHDD